MNKTIEKLLELLPFQEEGSGVANAFEEDGLKVNYSMTDSKICISIEKSEDPFMKYCDGLDDDIFLAACEKFVNVTGMSLSDFNDKLNKKEAGKEILQFKKCVRDVALKKIEQLNKYCKS